MKKNLVWLLFLMLCIECVCAQTSYYRGNTDYFSEIEPVENQLDSMQSNFRFSYTHKSPYDTILYNTYNFAPDEVPTYESDITKERLRSIPAVVPMDYNRHVQRYIDLYTVKRRDQMSRMLGLKEVYFPIFEQELDKAGLPIELKYLTIVESALNPHARSPMGATGLWQFMHGTGQQYGLKINSLVDERKDPYKATKAAINYFQDMYEIFDGDWLMIIASYNCGPMNVKKAILKSGKKDYFWDIYPYLPKETRGYVPAFIAATYAFYYASEHNLYPEYVDLSLEQDTVHIHRMKISLSEISRMTGADYNLLKNLNPELLRQTVPYTSKKPYILQVPYKVSEYFTLYRSSVRSRNRGGYSNYASASQSNSYSSSRKKTTPRTKPKTQKKPATRGATSKSNTSKNAAGWTTYTVRHGDSVARISKKYGVTMQQIVEWNNIKKYTIHPGQKLKIKRK